MHSSEDATPSLHSAWRSATAAAAVVEAGSDKVKAAASGPPMAGALVLRGSRCVLVRSLSEPPEWSGMRIPAVEVLPDGSESYVEAAVRSVEEQVRELLRN